MKVYQFSESTKIYLEQIQNHIEKEQGYLIVRKHLLKQINNCHGQNADADQSLVPAVLQKLTYSLLSEDTQKVSRTIDIFEDLIKYAQDIVCPALNNQDFCLTLSICIEHKKIIAFNKEVIAVNKERLASILIFLFKKYQSDPLRYSPIINTYKTLRQKQCNFPMDTFIIIPKVNQFVNKIKQKQPEKIGVTFDSIISFVNTCQKKFNQNKNQCANTQFVRSLKVKAKTLYDLSQSQGSYQLNEEQKQQAKRLYKKLRTMLKQLQKLNEANIKLKKIKEQKQFIANKIQNLTPKKEQISPVKSNKSQKNKEQPSGNLLNTGNKCQTSEKKKQSAIQEDDMFGQYQQNEVSQKQISSGKKSIVNETPKKLRKPPTQESQQKKIQSSNLLDDEQNNQIIKMVSVQSNKSNASNNSNLLDQQQNFGRSQKKSVQSIHSNKSCQSDKKIKNFDQKSNNSDVEFNNANNFSKFQIVNTIVDPNKYNRIPNDLNLTPSSESHSQNQQGKVNFQQNQNNFFQKNSKDYDIFNTPKKIQSSKQSEWQSIQKMPKSAKTLSQKQKTQLEPNQNFGVLVDNRIVQAYDYSKLVIVNSPSKISQQSQQAEIKITSAGKQSKKQQDQDFTQYIATNSDKKIQVKNEDLDDLLI